jgi:hypothetical protein
MPCLACALGSLWLHRQGRGDHRRIVKKGDRRETKEVLVVVLLAQGCFLCVLSSIHACSAARLARAAAGPVGGGTSKVERCDALFGSIVGVLEEI